MMSISSYTEPNSKHYLLDVVRSAFRVNRLLPAVRKLNVAAPILRRRQPTSRCGDMAAKENIVNILFKHRLDTEPPMRKHEQIHTRNYMRNYSKIFL